MSAVTPPFAAPCGALFLTLGAVAALEGQNVPASAAGQPSRECVVIFTGVTLKGVPSHSAIVRTFSGAYNTFYGGGFNARCEGTDQRLRSDSAEHWGDDKKLILIGHVHYTEARLKLDADLITYFTAEERLVAEGNVSGVTSTGTRFRGPRAEYLRVARGVRDRSRLTAESRPNVWLSPKDAGPGAKDSVSLQADRVISDNDSLVYAKGRVVIERSDLLATSDSAFLDNGREFARLTLTPKVVGRGERKFALEGGAIEVFSRQRQVQRVKSFANARATSEDVTLEADTIDLRIADEKLARAYAWGARRASAHAKGQDMTADSIDVVMPGQVLREMRAVRHARAESRPDSTRIVSVEPDFLLGDTIVARFDSVAAAGDTAGKPAVRQIVATGSLASPAASFYQDAPSEADRTGRPNINYVTGRRITVDFRNGQVRNVNVKDKVSGIYLEAVPDSARAKAALDSAVRATTKKPAGGQP